METVFVGMGSNLGNRKSNIKKALLEMKKHFKILKVSSIYETEKWGRTEGNSFYNCVAETETELSPKIVLEKLLEIEKIFGRKRKTKTNSTNSGNKVYLARKIDLDLLFYGKKVLKQKGLIVPHPKLQERNFVLVPLEEIAGGFVHPLLKKSIKSLVKASKDIKKVKRISKLEISF